MFTLKDIKMLQIPEDTKMIVIQEAFGDELDPDIKIEISKQIKKATKLPVVFVPYGVKITPSKEENYDWN